VHIFFVLNFSIALTSSRIIQRTNVRKTEKKIKINFKIVLIIIKTYQTQTSSFCKNLQEYLLYHIALHKSGCKLLVPAPEHAK
jgi:hypothetical protein